MMRHEEPPVDMARVGHRLISNFEPTWKDASTDEQ